MRRPDFGDFVLTFGMSLFVYNLLIVCGLIGWTV